MQSKVHGLGNTYENEEPEDFILVSFLPNLPLIFIVVPFVLSCPTGLLLYFILAFCSFGGGVVYLVFKPHSIDFHIVSGSV